MTILCQVHELNLFDGNIHKTEFNWRIVRFNWSLRRDNMINHLCASTMNCCGNVNSQAHTHTRTKNEFTLNEPYPFHFHCSSSKNDEYVWFIYSFIYLWAMIVEIQWNHVRFAHVVYTGYKDIFEYQPTNQNNFTGFRS